jgi:RNA recognition motif-containing protein
MDYPDENIFLGKFSTCTEKVVMQKVQEPVISTLQLQQNQYGEERNQEATVYVGNIDERVTEPLLWELFIQCGPVVNVHLPKDRITNVHQGYGFVEFMSEEDADYTLKVICIDIDLE